MSNVKDFENNVKKIEEFAEILENGDAPLEQTLEAYAQAVALIKSCSDMLYNAEAEIKILAGAENGLPSFHDFNVENEKYDEYNDDDDDDDDDEYDDSEE